MIYIIAGIAKSGKSIIAKEILTKYHMQVISTDWIMMMLYHGNKDLKIDVERSDVTVSHFLEPYLEGLIESLVNLKTDYLIEGVHIQPEFADRILKKHPLSIRLIFLGYKDMDPNLKASELKLHEHTMDNPWYKHLNDQELFELTSYLKEESKKLRDACDVYNMVYFEVKDINLDKEHIINYLFHKHNEQMSGGNT